MPVCARPECAEIADKCCAKCGDVFYCCRRHQKEDWGVHKLVCIATNCKASDFSDFIKASQHGTVRLSPTSSAKGLATDGMSACIALIFSSETTGKISLSHTPLCPSKEALQKEAQWTGNGTTLTIVRGYHYANPIMASRCEWPMVFQMIEKNLADVDVTVHVSPSVASRGCVTANWAKKTGKLHLSVPQKYMNTGHSNPNLDFVGFSPHDIQSLRNANNLHHCTLQLSGKVENVMADGLSLLLEYDGEDWTRDLVLPALPLQILNEFWRVRKITVKFLRKCEWSRDDGLNGKTADNRELQMVAADIEQSLKLFALAYSRK